MHGPMNVKFKGRFCPNATNNLLQTNVLNEFTILFNDTGFKFSP